ncbi:hypothetical protein [Afipia carboxidovorans]|uniref:hypothetical protein n=1 Tax=Afipia carboxidovorans TaxID=40137 RepID=UPI00309009B7|nr:hypothetical protein CRBSH125_00880 [Afipia carboxidovorans]
MTVFGGFITGGTVSTDPDDATKLNFSGIVINGALGAVAGDTFSAGGFQVPIASIDGTGAATLVYAFPVALDDVSAYAIARDSAERYNPAATNILVRQYLAKIADASITYVVPDDGDGPTDLIAPDPQEGQKAIRFSNPWKTWLYTEGAWVEQPGSPGEQGSTILSQDTEPSTDYPTNSIWIDSGSADLDVYELIGIPLVWTDTGINLKGATGATAWLPPEDWATATEYTAGPPASLVIYGGETYACLEDHESDNFYTDLAAGKWIKVAAKGADGLGTGDVVGPSSSTDAHIVLFDGVTGKAIQDSGVTLDDFATVEQGGKADSAVQPDAVREMLTDNRTYYVDTTNGNDSNSGLAAGSGNAFKTIQKAYDVIAAKLDLAGYTVTIQIADGTYAPSNGVCCLSVSGPWTGGGSIIIQGNATTPSNVTLSTTNASGIVVTAPLPGLLTLKDFKIQTATAGDSISLQAPGSLRFGNLNFGASAGAHITVNAPGGNIAAIANYTISGGATLHVAISGQATVTIPVAVTLVGTPNFSVRFVNVIGLAYLDCSSASFSGSATGVRYGVFINAVIFSNGGSATFFPGNAAGVSGSGGIYN